MSNLNGTGGPPGLGDMMPPPIDPMERYFNVIRGQVQLPKRPWIVKPNWKPPTIPGMESLQQFVEEHDTPRRWQLAEDFFTLLQRGRFFIKSPNWLEPPITAEMADLVSETAVVLAATDTVVLTYTVPDRCVCSFRNFGHNLSDSAEWGNVIWTIMVNKRPIRTYHDFRLQRGVIVAPTPFPKPITLKGRDTIEILARRGAVAVSGYARISGFLIPVETVTQDGSYKDWMSR